MRDEAIERASLALYGECWRQTDQDGTTRYFVRAADDDTDAVITVDATGRRVRLKPWPA